MASTVLMSQAKQTTRQEHSMSKVHNGVLIPAELEQASTSFLDTYAATVKEDARAFIAAANALEDRADELGVELDGH